MELDKRAEFFGSLSLKRETFWKHTFLLNINTHFSFYFWASDNPSLQNLLNAWIAPSHGHMDYPHLDSSTVGQNKYQRRNKFLD